MKKLLLLATLLITNIYSNAQDIICSSTFNLENPNYNGLYFINNDTANVNLWQIGNPDKLIFQNSLSGSYSIVTDTTATYPAGNKSVFVLSLYELLGNCRSVGFKLSTHHSMNTDSLAGGYVEISMDSINWHNIYDGNFTDDFNYIIINCEQCPQPDTLFNGQLGFKGNFANNFLEIWFGPMVKANNWPFVRFTFVSDTNATAGFDGWMLDDFYIETDYYSSVSENLSKSITLYPNPTTDKLAFTFDENKFKPTELAITNVLGQQVLKTRFQKTVDVSTLQQGVYYVTVTDSKGNAAAKMFYKQ